MLLTKLSDIKARASKFFFRKDKNYVNGLLIGLIITVIVGIMFCTNSFAEMETFLQALIFQMGYKLPDNPREVIVVKKDQTSSALMGIDPNRRDYASLINLLGSKQKRDRMLYKSRSQTFELFSLNFGYYENIRNQRPIATSYDEWRNFIDISDEKEKKESNGFNQDKWQGTSRQLTDWFKKNKNETGFFSFVKATGKTWLPRGTNIFKILAGGNDYLIFPTLDVDWTSEAVKDVVEKLTSQEKNENINYKKTYNNKKSNQSIDRILNRWANFFENLQYAEIVFDIKIFPENKKKKESDSVDKTFFSLSIKLKTYGRDTTFEVEPAAIIGFDFVLQGEKEKEYDKYLEEALKNTKSKIILAAYSHTEIIKDEKIGDENSFSQEMQNITNNNENKDESYFNQSVSKYKEENILIKPYDIFLNANKEKVDYALIDMRQNSKSYIKEAPIIIKVNEDVYEKGKLVATQTIKPAFGLRIALEKMDLDNKKFWQSELANSKEDLSVLSKEDSEYLTKKYELETKISKIEHKLKEPSYVEVQKEVFKQIRKDFCNGKFNGILKIKDLKIPLNQAGRLYVNFSGSTKKGSQKYAAIDSVSFYECLEDKLLNEYLKKNPSNIMLSPNFAHRRIMNKEKNKGNKVFIVGPFEQTDMDFYPTPISYRTPFQISKDPLMGIEIHANVIRNILNRKFIKHPSDTLCLLCIIISSIFTSLVLEMVSPIVGAFLALLFAFTTFSYSYFSYHVIGQVFQFAPLLVSIGGVWVSSTLINYLKQRTKAKATKDMFSKFVSADVVQYMLDNPDLVRPGGSKNELTIFFSDVAGFTSISEALSPEELVVLLNEYLGAMTDLLFEYGGTLDKFIGDAVMAFWNFPKNQEDHAVRAVLCALAMQKKIKELQIGWAKRGLPKVAARCGINTAAVVVGYMGSQKAQMNFTCMGDGVNLASRLEGANKEYGTMMMVSDATYQKVKHVIRGRFLDFLAVKGKKEPVKVYELVCKHGEEPEGWFERKAMYDDAIQLHLERKWDEAIAKFEAVLSKYPDDGPSKTYITRCKEYKDNPPPEGWDGRYILTHK